jgi:hypothetical protein
MSIFQLEINYGNLLRLVFVFLFSCPSTKNHTKMDCKIYLLTLMFEFSRTNDPSYMYLLVVYKVYILVLSYILRNMVKTYSLLCLMH